MNTQDVVPAVPEINKLYTARGYTFRVDLITDGDVFCTRWKPDSLTPVCGDRVRLAIGPETKGSLS
jgi:hypothetical protein